MAAILRATHVLALKDKPCHGLPLKTPEGDLPDIGIQLPANSFQLPRHDGPPDCCRLVETLRIKRMATV